VPCGMNQEALAGVKILDYSPRNTLIDAKEEFLCISCDSWARKPKTQRFRSGVKNSRVIEVHNTNHYVFIVDEALVVRETRKFLLDESSCRCADDVAKVLMEFTRCRWLPETDCFLQAKIAFAMGSEHKSRVRTSCRSTTVPLLDIGFVRSTPSVCAKR